MISIIVPVYNAEDYIDICLDSIISQSNRDWECILVDDGSSDSSGLICENYAKKDSRFKVYHKKNGGVSSARNYGLRYASRDKVMFLDSDDYLLNNYLDNYVRHSNVDYVVGGYSIFGQQNKNIQFEEIVTYDLKKDDICCVDGLKGSPYLNILFHICGKMYDMGILRMHNITFDEQLKLAEDVCFNMAYLQHCRDMKLIIDCGYYYRASLSFSKFLMDFDRYSYHRKTFLSSANIFEAQFAIKINRIKTYIMRAYFDGINELIGNYAGSYKDYKALYRITSINSLFKMYSDNTKRLLLFTISKALPPPIGYKFIKFVYKRVRG